MVNHKHHKVFIGITAIAILVIGLFLGAYLAANLGSVDLQVVNIALTFTSIILLLVTGGLVLEIKEMLSSKNKK